MHRIDSPGHLLNQWTQGDPVSGVEPTEVSADFMNAVQEEIANVIEATGASLNKADNTQLFQAISLGLINPWANRLLNTTFEFWQREGDDPQTGGVTLAGADDVQTFRADRWIMHPGTGGAATVTREEFALGTIPIGMESQGQPRYYMRWDQTGGGTVKVSFKQRIEGVRTFAGQKISVSFVARVTSGTENVFIELQQNFGDTGTPSVVVDYTAAVLPLTTTWTRFTRTFTLLPLTGKTIGTDGNDFLEVLFSMPLSSTYTVEVTDARITPGVSTNNTLLLPSDVDFWRCRRYYQKSYSLDQVPGTNSFPGASAGIAKGETTGSIGVTGANITLEPYMRVPMQVGVGSNTRAASNTDGLQRVWRPGGTPTLGSIDWDDPAGGPQVIASASQSTRRVLNNLVVTAPGFATVREWEFQWDADAEIILNP